MSDTNLTDALVPSVARIFADDFASSGPATRIPSKGNIRLTQRLREPRFASMREQC